MKVTVPERWKSTFVSKQGYMDWTCGAHCLATAAVHFGTRKGSRTLAMTLLLEAEHERGQPGFVRRVHQEGMWPAASRAVARVAGLRLYVPRVQEYAQLLEPGLVWLAFMPKLVDETHYVLVLDASDDGDLVFVVDPHPTKPDIYAMSRIAFEQAWKPQRKDRRCWAANVYPATAP